MTDVDLPDPWDGDLLDYQEIGSTYTKLIQSIDDSKVISIEAGFGHGKTFFRKAWAKHLRNEGEIVVEVDAQQSDHSGDPVVTFLAALMEKLERGEQSRWTKTISKSTGIAVGTAKILATVVARKAGEEAVEGIEKWLESDGATSDLDQIIGEFSQEASKSLIAQLTAQLAAERVRTTEMPKQLELLRKKLTENSNVDRVVIIIDELDRCHPSYAIDLLEAMKLVFNQDGFVFVLMANTIQLEQLADRLFGSTKGEEEYLDKFVDIRLKLPMSEQVLGQAAYELVKRIPFGEPFGDGAEFSVERACELAKNIAPASGLTMRQIKRVLLRVELALRCYNDEPVDGPLLVYLAFSKKCPEKNFQKYLPRVALTKAAVDDIKIRAENGRLSSEGDLLKVEMQKLIRRNCSELLNLPESRYRLPDDRPYYDWGRVMHLADYYMASHEEKIDAVHLVSSG